MTSVTLERLQTELGHLYVLHVKLASMRLIPPVKIAMPVLFLPAQVRQYVSNAALGHLLKSRGLLCVAAAPRGNTLLVMPVLLARFAQLANFSP